jgi:hypothetical protein
MMTITTYRQKFIQETALVSDIRAPWLIIFGRTLLFLGVQALFALAFSLVGSQDAWAQSADWWPIGVVLTNTICLLLLLSQFRGEGRSYWEVFRIRRAHIKGDLLAVFAWMAVAGPAGFFPNVLLAGWLFGDSLAVLDMFVRPLPLWAVYAAIFLFPITQGLVETPLYFGYGMPRLMKQGLPAWLSLTIPAVMLGFQHLAVPFLFDLRFVVWRAFMYLPFAFVIGLMLLWRPRLQPYIAIIHVLMNMSFATMFLGVAY